MGKVATFNSLSRDHFVNAIAYSEGSSMSSAFNSLSRDHAGEASGPRGSVGCHLSTPSLGITSLSRRPESDSKRSLSTPSLGITALVVGGYASATAGLNLSTPSLGITGSLALLALASRLNLDTFNSLSRDHRELKASLHCAHSLRCIMLSNPSLGITLRRYRPSTVERDLTFNSLSRDHEEAAFVTADRAPEKAFNSLSRDHMIS